MSDDSEDDGDGMVGGRWLVGWESPGVLCSICGKELGPYDSNIPQLKYCCSLFCFKVHIARANYKWFREEVLVIENWWLVQRKKMFRKPTKSAQKK